MTDKPHTPADLAKLLQCSDEHAAPRNSPPTPKQAIVLESSADLILVHGDRGCGKSWVGREWLMQNRKRGLYVVPDRKSVMQAHGNLLEQWQGHSYCVGLRAARGGIPYIQSAEGYYVFVSAFEDMEKCAGMDFDRIFVDDVERGMTLKHFYQLQLLQYGETRVMFGKGPWGSWQENQDVFDKLADIFDPSSIPPGELRFHKNQKITMHVYITMFDNPHLRRNR